MATKPKLPVVMLGFGQQTPAVQALVRPKTRRKKRVTKKRPAAKRTRSRTTRTTTARKKYSRKKKPARLVKGSAAAKRHMAKLRRMRKR